MLPIVADTQSEPCDGCHGDCCLAYDVPLSGRDLARLCDGLGAAWTDVARLEPVTGFSGYRLDRSGARFAFYLRRAAEGACAFLVGEGGHRRCGVHALRPDVCRIYPLRLDRGAPGGVVLADHIVCPEERRARYAGIAHRLSLALAADAAELALEDEARERWDVLARATPVHAPLGDALLAEWLLALHRGLAPLREASAADWLAVARARIAEFALPER